MKKLMTSTIILLPLLILAIMLVSGAIMGLVTYIHVDTVEFSDSKAVILVMSDEEDPPTYDLAPEVTVLPLKAPNRDVEFSVADSDLVKVDENGVLTAVFYGETYVTVTSADNTAVSAQRKVIVTDSAVHKVEIGSYKDEMYESSDGEDFGQQLSVSVYPKEAKDTAVEWSSSDESILQVDPNGYVRAVGAGTATVTVKSKSNGDVFATADIKCHTKLRSLAFNGDDNVDVVTSQRECTFPTLKHSPENADITMSYESSDTDIATVDGNGKITFKKEGKVTITATASDFEGHNSISKEKTYTSTDGYYIAPLFEQKSYTFDYDQYNKDSNTPLPIQFATKLEGSYREFKSVEYTIDDVLTFNEDTKKFYFVGEMPIELARTPIEVTVRAMVYDETGVLKEYRDQFTLTVLRNAKSVAVAYRGTADAATILTDSAQFSFAGSGQAAAAVSVSPANHTNALSYSLVGTDSAVATLEGGRLSFKKDGAAKVKIVLSDGKRETVSREVTVIYEKPVSGSGGSVKKVEVPADSSLPAPKVLLSMDSGSSAGKKDEGTIYFTEPEGKTVEYTVETVGGNEGVVEIGTVESGAHRIIPKKGGFAKVIITVSPKQSQTARVSRLAAPLAGEAGGDVVVYTIPVYVDLPVSADDFRITLDGGEFASQFGTQKNAVAYTFTAADKNGSMEGKQLYVKRGSAKDVLSSEDGTIEFAANLSTLEVTFGVEYTSQATGDYQADPNGLMSVTRTVTIHRDATDLAVSYQNVTGTAAIQTSVASLTFRTSDVADGKTIVVTAAPANHTDIIKYTLAGGDSEVASLTGGQLTFKRAGSVTVTISAHREWDDSEVFSKTITVSYAPAGGNVKAFDFSGKETKTEQLLFDANGETTEAVIYLTVPETVKPEYKAAENDGVVSLAPEGGLYRIKPAKGGFATVMVTAGDEVYTIKIYVDKPVTAEDFNITLDGKPFADAIGTKENAVAYTFTASPENGGMAGKKLSVKYGDPVKIAEGGTIEFAANLSTLEVTFGVEYDEAAKAYGVDGSALTSITRTVTIHRDATGVSVAYRGVDNTTTIQTSVSSLEFLTSGAADENSIIVTVTPATHTDTLEYSLEEGEGIASISNNRTLKFTAPDQAGTVKVKISLKNWKGDEVLAATITVNYAPPKPENKVIDLNEGETYNVLLTMTSASSMDKGEIHLLVPDGSAADYQVEGSDGVVTVTEENGYHYIVPQKGGFATVKVTVTGGEEKVYTINVYVNRRVNSDNIKIKLGGEQAPSSANFDTTLTKVPFEVTVDGEDGCMEGKKLYFYTTAADAKQYHTDDALTYSGEITFEDTLSTLTVHFGVEYTEKAKVFKPADGLPSTSRTLERNAETVTVAFNGITTTHIQTSNSVVTFGESGTAKVTVAPVHTDTLKYTLEGEASVASMIGGRLTFTKEGTVTVKVQLARENGSRVTCEGVTITVSYAGAKAGRTLLDFSGKETETEHLLFDANGETKEAVILLTAPAGVTPKYAETKNGGVIDFRSEGGVYHITAKKGGFAAVTVTAWEKTYTVEIYVDKPVTSDNFKVKFDKEETPARTTFGTTLTEVPVNFEVDPADGAMEGKKLYFYVGEKSSEKTYGTDNALTLTGSVAFEKTLSTLPVHFGVEYTEETENFAPEDGLSSTSRTLERNADSVTVTFDDVQTAHIQTHSANIIFGESGAAKVSVSPETHTDTLKYVLVADSSVAELVSGNNTVHFKKEGTVTVKVQLTRGNDVTLEKVITVDYAPVAGTTKALDLGGESGAQNFLFDANGDTAEGVLFLTEPEGADVEYAVTKGENDVISMTEKDGLHRITAKKGGFATVTVTVTPKTREAVTTYTVEIYVNKAVKTSDFAVQFNGQPWDKADNFLTSLMQVGYSVTVSDGDSDGSLEGKQLYISYGSSPTLVDVEEGTYTKADTASLQTGETTFTFGVKYTAKAAAIVGENERGLDTATRTVQTSNDKLTASPTVSVSKGQTTLSPTDALTFDDIGEEITLTVHGPYTPTDFVLDEGQIKVEDGTQFVSSSVSYLEGNSAKIVLKALKVTGSSGCQISVTIGGQQFKLTATVHAKAQTIEVKCGATVLEQRQDKYLALAGTLNLTLTLKRGDGQAIFNKGLKYQFGASGDQWQEVTADSSDTVSVTLKLPEIKDYTLTIQSLDGGAAFTVTIERTTLDDFGFVVTVNVNEQSDPRTIGTVDSVKATHEIAPAIPTDALGTVTLTLNYTGDFLGGFGTEDDFKALFKAVSDNENWNITYDTMAKKIFINMGTTTNYHNTVTLSCGDLQIKIELSRVNIKMIEFEGFDIGSNSDVYKGYQQVRVFAKHSDYGENKEDTATPVTNTHTVDYFKMPYAAWGDMERKDKVFPQDLTWNLARYVKDKQEGFTLRQQGYTFMVGEDQYTIDDADGNGVYVLKKGETVVVGEDGKFVDGQTKVTWVDPYSEEGFVRIYFGDFVGLSEVDIQNDYFGNYGEQPEWTPAETHADQYDGSQRAFTPSAGAFSFLRVEAGDGAEEGGVNRHFNFNVLEDWASSSSNDGRLINVSSATAYYRSKNIVLQENLYGIGELEGETNTAAATKDLILNKTVLYENGTDYAAYANKNVIIGNGYQVNLNTLSQMIIDSGTRGDHGYLWNSSNSQPENTGHGSHFNSLYNVRMKGRNDTEKIVSTEVCIFFICDKIYYTDLQYYGKLNNKVIYIKNSVLHNVSLEAVELWDSSSGAANSQTVYLENVVMINVMKSVILENHAGHTVNVKGFLDVFNYQSFKTLKNIAGPLVTDKNIVEILSKSERYGNYKVNKYMEWFGKTQQILLDCKMRNGTPDAMRGAENAFVNPVIIDVSQGGTGGIIKAWNGTAYDKQQTKEKLNLVAPLTGDYMDPGCNGMITAYTYNYENGLDGGNVTVSHISDLDTSNGGQGYASNYVFFGTATRSDFSSLFTSQREMRLLCEYVGLDNNNEPIPNNDHMIWHMQKAYRDMSLLSTKREENHVEALKQSLINAANSGTWDGTWPDGSSLKDAIPDAVRTLTTLLSHTLPPDPKHPL